MMDLHDMLDRTVTLHAYFTCKYSTLNRMLTLYVTILLMKERVLPFNGLNI